MKTPINILHLEDNTTDAELVRLLLESDGIVCRIRRTGSRDEFEAAFQNQRFDLIISDYTLPSYDGLSALKFARHRCPEVPFIFVSATIGEEAAVESLKQGAVDYILKDRLTRLGASVRRAVEETAQREERRRIEEQLRKQDELFRRIGENAEDLVAVLDVEGRRVYNSPSYRKLLGDPQLLVGTDSFAEIHPDDRERIQRIFRETVANGAGQRAEYRFLLKDGSVRFVESQGSVIRDEEGRVANVVVISRDVTGRRQAEEALRESERLLRLVIDLVPHFIFAKDAKSRHLFANRACAEASGLTPEQMVGRRDLDLVADWAQAEAFMRDDQEVIASGQPKLIPEESFTDRTGATRFLQTIKIPFAAPGTGAPALLGVAVDITERKRAEQRLAAHHAITQFVAESATLNETAKKILQFICQELQWDVGGLWTLDRTAKRLRCVEIWHPPSTEFKEFVTVSRQNAFAVGESLPGRVWQSGRPVWIADVAQESDLPRKSVAMRIGLHGAIAFPIRLRDETLGVIEFFSARIRPPDDELLAMFVTAGSQIGQFIERKQIEEQFRQSQKMEAFGQLAGGVAHDFNNILAVVMGYANLLLSDEKFSPEVTEQLKQIYSAGERAANLTRQLLTFSRKKEMQVNPLDLNEVIRNITKMLSRIIGEDIKLECNYASDLPSILGDEGMMEQVVMNLAVNARDAMPQGGELIIGTGRVLTDADYVHENPEARVGEFVCLSMQDTGCGMTPEIKARIFEPFFTTKGVGKGTGLGLATVYGIVKQHQGWLDVESQVGVGTVFKVFLPASARPDAAVELAATRAKVRGGKETILLVEDEVALRALTKIVLQRYGYRVLEAASGEEALSVWERHGSQIDLLLTDMVMPDGLTGRELAKQLLARKPNLKVIYVSGYNMESEGTTFRAREAATFLQKPYHPQKLAETIRDCLDGKRT